LHPGDPKKKRKRASATDKNAFLAKKLAKSRHIMGSFFMKLSDVDNRFQHVAKIQQSS
jgi:hypothetical protein